MNRKLVIGFVIFIIWLMSGCAAIMANERVQADCGKICRQYSTIPIMHVSIKQDEQNCHCEAFYFGWERKFHKGAAESVSITCHPDCATVAKKKSVPCTVIDNTGD